MGYLQNGRQHLASAGRVVGKHALTAGKVALAAAAVAGAAYNAHQTHSAVDARRAQAEWQAERGRRRFEELARQPRAPRPRDWDPHNSSAFALPPGLPQPVRYNDGR